MKAPLAAILALAALAAPASAGDAEKGAKEFNKCKSCHTIASATEVIAKGGKTGPNLYGVVGRVVGSQEDFRYGSGLAEAAEKELVWDEAGIAEYVTDPSAYIEKITGDPNAKSKMTFKLKDGADVAAYLATFPHEEATN